MTELIQRKLGWATLTQLEQFALTSSILIWIGVALFGGGLYVAIRNYNLEQQAYAQATAIALSSPTTSTPTPTTEVFPMGWVTATPTSTPWPTNTPEPSSVPMQLAREPGRIAPTAPPAPEPVESDHPAIKPASAPRKAESDSSPPPASSPPDRIIVPKINLDSEIVPIGWYVVEQGNERYGIWQVADYVVSWHKTSAYPGHNGNIVLNGHHNIKGEVFRYLVDLEAGDRVLLYADGQVYYYTVEQKMILKEKGEPPDVRQQNATWIAPTNSEQLTMVTCWPYTNNTHRLVVVAKPASAPPSAGLEE